MRGMLLVIALGGLMAVAGCGGGGSSPRTAGTGSSTPAGVTQAGTTSSGDVLPAAVVEVSSYSFAPHELRVRAGDVVAWRFDGVTPHTVTAFNGAFDSGIIGQGVFAVRFDTPGTYCYRCLPHPGANLCATDAGASAVGEPGDTKVSARVGAPGPEGSPSLPARGDQRMSGRIVVLPP